MTEAQKKIIKSSAFSFLGVYLNFFLGLLSTFSIARIITPEEWGLLLIAESFVATGAFLCSLFPPGAEGSIEYYIPHLKGLGGNRDIEIREFILHNYRLRSLSGLIGFFVYLIVIFSANIELTLLQLTLILSPKILLSLIQNLNIAIITAFQKFKFLFIVMSIHVFNISIGNFSILLINPLNSILIVAIVNLLGLTITMAISFFYILKIIPKKRKISQSEVNHKKNFYKLHKTYGLPLVFTGLIAQMGNLASNLIFLAFGFVQYITYLSICETIITSTLKFSSSDRTVQMTIFSEINYDKNPENYKKTFYQYFKYLSLIVCIFTAIFYYFIDVYIDIIYSEVYSIVLLIIPIYIFQTFSRLINRNLLVLVYSTNHTKISIYYSIIQTVNNLIVTCISLAFFNFTTLIIFYLATSYLLNILTILLIRKIVGFKINILKLIYPFLIYTVSFFITIPFTYFINVQLFSLIILNDVSNSLVHFLIFLIPFYILIYMTKFITREEFSQLMIIMPGKRFRNRFIQKIIENLTKLFPSQKVIS